MIHLLSLRLLNYALGVVFVWFGVLKLFNASPALELFKSSLPGFLGNSEFFLFAFSFLELLIGIGLFLKRTRRFSSVIMILHLIVTTSVIMITRGFDPRFPILSYEGEFAVKNIALLAGGLVLLSNREEESEDLRHE